MKKIILIYLISLFLIQSGCTAQKPKEDKTYHGHHRFSPCFQTEYPKIINLPDSFGFKQKKYSAILDVDCYFDSIGNVLEIIPFKISIKNKETGKWTQEFIFRKGWEDSAINMSKEEADKYAAWAVKELPLVTKIKRYTPNIKCTQVITNRNVYVLDYNLE